MSRISANQITNQAADGAPTVQNGLVISGVCTATSFSGIDTDKISEGNTEAEVVDTGSDGHFKVPTEGGERIRVGPAGQIGIAGANYGSSGFDASQSGKVVSGVGSSDKATASITGELRRVVKVEVRGSGKTHISEVQITGDF